MPEEYEFENQRPDEKVILFRHQHPWVLAKVGIWAVILAIIVVISFLIWGLNIISWIVLLLSAIIITAYFLLKMYLYRNGIFLVTDQRIINILQASLFRREVQEVELENIQNIVYKINGMIKSFLNFGEVEILTQGNTTSTIVLKNVENPHFIYEQISKAKQKRSKS